MPRKIASPAIIGPDWFLQEWMNTQRVIAADIGRETGWAKSRISEIVNGKTGYYREIVNELSRVLRIQPFELLMHPEDAFAIRRLQDTALQIAAEPRVPFTPAEPESNRLKPLRRAH